MTEIPVSVPDDDILVERMGLSDGSLLQGILMGMYTRAQKKNGILVIQAHPERFAYYQNAFTKLIQRVKEQNQAWIAPLRDIARWWRNREDFTFDIERIENGRYCIRAHCKERTTVLAKNLRGSFPGTRLWNKACTIPDRIWEMESPRKPIIGVHPDVPDHKMRLVKDDGFVFEYSSEADDYNVYINRLNVSGVDIIKYLHRKVTKTSYPLLRFWRWPDEAVYAMSITGDIDAVDLIDYWSRFHG